MKGMTYNGVHSSVFSLACSPHYPLLPEKRKNTIEIPGVDGVYDFGNDSYAPIPIAVNCMVKNPDPDTLDELLEQIAGWLSGSGYLTFDGKPTRRRQAKVYSSIDPQKMAVAAFFQVVFEAHPYAEDIDLITGTIGSAQDYGSKVIFFPIITVHMTSSASSVQVSLPSTGQYVLFVDSLVNGDDIAIDMATGKVTKNGVTAMDKVRLTGSLFFGVLPGTQTITVTTTGTYDADIQYRRRYRYG